MNISKLKNIINSKTFRWSLPALIVILFAAIACVYITYGQKLVEFQDKALQKMIMKGINKDKITERDISGINSLIIVSNEKVFLNDEKNLSVTALGCIVSGEEINTIGEITSLEDIKQFKNLKSLSIVNNEVTSVPNLSALPLEKVSLAHNFIHELPAQCFSKSITTLNMDYNFLSSIDSLSSLTNIQSLSFQENMISNIQPASDLLNLKTLNAANNQIKTISPLEKLPKLESLNLNQNQLTECSETISSLQELEASFNQIKKLTLHAPSIKKITMSHNQLEGILDLSPYTKLKEVNLGLNLLTGIIGAEKDTDLRDLNVSYNKITDTGKISVPAKISSLNISGNQLSDISPFFSKIKEVTDLNISDCGIQNINGIDSIMKLKTLQLYNNPVKDKSALNKFKLQAKIYE